MCSHSGNLEGLLYGRHEGVRNGWISVGAADVTRLTRSFSRRQ